MQIFLFFSCFSQACATMALTHQKSQNPGHHPPPALPDIVFIRAGFTKWFSSGWS
jgi:hypothetical protein